MHHRSFICFFFSIEWNEIESIGENVGGDEKGSGNKKIYCNINADSTNLRKKGNI